MTSLFSKLYDFFGLSRPVLNNKCVTDILGLVDIDIGPIELSLRRSVIALPSYHDVLWNGALVRSMI